ncbi:MAG TPA: TonB-dependent receptor [bacterium]|nr:TonB-dependent receptor [bacterium]HPN45657.1 TonB-dependent receptor [bacterium]
MTHKRFSVISFAMFMVMFLVCSLWAGTTGKIAGTITDAENGDPLPGANIVVRGTNLGSAADINGNFTVLHVPPGTYTVDVTVIGYSKMTVNDVRVLIDQTFRLNVDMKMEVLEGEAVTIVAERNALREDVSTSVVAVSADEVQELPVASVQSVVGLQAGVQGYLEIRGGGADEALFLMDGVTLRDPRNNQPVSGLALSAIKEISIERGGFNAEYGQVRSGIINVVTREGSKASYAGNIEFKYSPPGKKHFGISPFDRNSMWMRPYLDNDVCWTGTKNGAWDVYTQAQYPFFRGWNAVSQELMTDNNPNNDLSPMAAQQVYLWEARKQPAYDQPDYNVDAGFGGPVPVIGKYLGDLRFFTSYRRYREMLVVPLTREDYVDNDWTMKVTSDITPSMKLMVSGMVGKMYTMQQNWSSYYIRDGNTIASVIGGTDGILFGTGFFSLADIGHKNVSAKLTHTLSPKMFYELSLEHFRRDYYSRPPEARDTATLYEVVPDYWVDEAPFGYLYDSKNGIAGMLLGGTSCKRRDNTVVSATTFKADVTNQVNYYNLVKAGAEFVYNDLDFDYGEMANFEKNNYLQRVQMRVFPIRAAMYVQDKLETKGFIMNLGLRLDYSNSNTEWWDVDPYNQKFFSSKYNENLDFTMAKSTPQWQLSPRLGISHPITENSKLFFNYGHFKQMPSYENLFRIGRASDRSMSLFGDPNLTLAKTVSYELGYDHILFNDFTLQMAAFYHDIFDQQNTTQYTSVSGIVYNKTTSNSYEDIRGFELTLRKNRGLWWSFFANYTYQVTTSGHFDRGRVYEDYTQQKLYDEATINLYQERPIPSPYARLNLTLYTPDKFGPVVGGIYPIGGYTANILLNWQAGPWTTHPATNQSLKVSNNVKTVDFFDSVLRFGKTIDFGKFSVQGFVDIENLFNYRRMSLSNFGAYGDDYNDYVKSLHLPESDTYESIPGDDKIGTYREDNIKYQPIFLWGQIDYQNDKGDAGVIYYEKSTSKYVEYVNDQWVDVGKTRLKKILDDKAYIDMPNMTSFTFFNPRQIFFGIRLTFDLK